MFADMHELLFKSVETFQFKKSFQIVFNNLKGWKVFDVLFQLRYAKIRNSFKIFISPRLHSY